MPATDGMPRPDDLAQAPLWKLYVTGQAVQASLGRIPVHTLAFGVVVEELQVQLCFQLSEETDADAADMDEIADDLDMLTGYVLDISRQVEVGEERTISPSGSPIWWLYLMHRPDEDDATQPEVVNNS